ncbi:Mbeg1-like protein [Candidatus Epulonipiscium viviparus]|uniref:Mbeg1-like protein n=1 Tax=Candidatus Epulonipiscium viviparus TaxID=420336 RepID=UPI00273815ED|nr:Mbeg1-like protein [Candidatus Epulopiscium viviparus]
MTSETVSEEKNEVLKNVLNVAEDAFITGGKLVTETFGIVKKKVADAWDVESANPEEEALLAGEAVEDTVTSAELEQIRADILLLAEVAIEKNELLLEEGQAGKAVLVEDNTLAALSDMEVAAINARMGYASVEELADWRVVDYFTERTDDTEDAKFGGFTYAVFELADNIVIAFRGSVGSAINTPLGKGDWYNNMVTYPYGIDPGGIWAENAIKELYRTLDWEGKNVYVTGHSRGGMLAQRAAAAMVEFPEFESQLVSINYFNGMGIIFNYAEFPVLETSIHNNEVKDDLASIAEKVNRHVMFRMKDGEIENDMTSKLGSHVKEANFIPYKSLDSENFAYEDLTVEDMALMPSSIYKIHFMKNYIADLRMPYRK